ncbi:MAG: hypothetical protein GYA15_10445 [Leptolinea sp.]|nr:hypothetical protein [Leptolinea sp.]
MTYISQRIVDVDLLKLTACHQENNAVATTRCTNHNNQAVFLRIEPDIFLSGLIHLHLIGLGKIKSQDR